MVQAQARYLHTNPQIIHQSKYQTKPTIITLFYTHQRPNQNQHRPHEIRLIRPLQHPQTRHLLQPRDRQAARARSTFRPTSSAQLTGQLRPLAALTNLTSCLPPPVTPLPLHSPLLQHLHTGASFSSIEDPVKAFISTMRGDCAADLKLECEKERQGKGTVYANDAGRRLSRQVMRL